jgi:hypothetical protein
MVKRCCGPIYLGADGRLTDGEGHVVFTDKVFTDPMDADLWLSFDDDARLFMAYINFDWRKYADGLQSPVR